MTTPAPSPTSEFDPRHEPVLVRDVVRWLAPRGDGCYIDGTLGLGGHIRALLDAGAGQVLGVDRDPAAVEAVRAAFGEHPGLRVTVGDYRRIVEIAQACAWTQVDGVLADLGVSSWQLDNPERGFSFRAAGPLDMRMDPTRGRSLAERLAQVDDGELADVIYRFGEERHSRRIARGILAARDRGELVDTMALAAVVRRSSGQRGWQRLDPATRTFQALRIWVNEELEGLDRFLEDAVGLLGPGGRCVVIAFHSLEDRVVKHTFRRLAAESPSLEVLTKRPVVPDEVECARNPRARSARLRVVGRAA